MVSALPTPWSWETRYDDMRVLEIAVLGLLLFAVLLRPQSLIGAWRGLPSWANWALVAFFALGALSASRAPVAEYAFIEWSWFAAMLLAGLRLSVSSPEPSRVRNWAAGLVVLGALALGWRFLVEMVALAVSGDPTGLQSSSVLFSNPRYFAKVATWLLPLLWLGSFLAPPHRARAVRGLCLLAGAMIAAHVLMSGSRAALLALGVTIVVAALAFGRVGRHYAREQLLYLLLGALVWGGIELGFGSGVFAELTRGGSSGRDVLVAEALREWLRSPWVGIGPMQLAIVATGSAAAPHNSLLQVLAEWGGAAATLFFAVSSAWLWNCFAETRRCAMAGDVSDGESRWNVAVFAAILAAAVQSLFANVINDPISQTLLVLFAGMASWSGAAVRERDAADRSGWRPLLAVRVLLLLAMLGLGLSFAKGSDCVGREAGSIYTPGWDGRVWPRLWTQGHIPLERTCAPRQ